ncbi:uncharacterized protein MELLADRAFT_103475 [Melampsora larici-populina 98AG31]|uniref:Uncharacterized protein n=1 Tax=Melampsora larici-populina (strain 98AG31 / pathotype 3-4-7) TaxID=747676 RepID=F4RB50_MELLP|nr:uncharacterized protein MELLADRAFT_103475 [Melampsora larici-populina 98AG31]EGG10346.1 hypothetical protein MELLADRAFT_103475 [Melampsora larici-populina 98AG31]
MEGRLGRRVEVYIKIEVNHAFRIQKALCHAEIIDHQNKTHVHPLRTTISIASRKSKRRHLNRMTSTRCPSLYVEVEILACKTRLLETAGIMQETSTDVSELISPHKRLQDKLRNRIVGYPRGSAKATSSM